MEDKIKNPILPGFYPDPSICRVDDDFYMVCSSFELYPGIPLFHSKDLANWEQISYVCTKENEFHVNAGALTGGVMAPTIRYHNGVFYVINANFGDKGNYIVTATNPKGPWSRPHWMTDIPGIDASLFFHDEKAYIVSTGEAENEFGRKERGIFLTEFDIENMVTVGSTKQIWNSAMRNAASPEAPHLYHVGSYFYLLIAEGGTENYHSVVVARSKELFGWYEGNPANPIMTHRQFGFQYELVNVGHADMVETLAGNWYAVLLGSRQLEGPHKNMGRETYICPVIWEKEWPVFSPGTGKVEWEYPADPDLKLNKTTREKIKIDDFDTEELGLEWNFLGTPYEDFWQISDSRLKLKCLKRPMSRKLKQIVIGQQDYNKKDCISFVGRRQQAVDFEVYCKMDFLPADRETAGLIILQAANHQYRLERKMRDGEQLLELILVTTSMTGAPHMPGFESESIEKILASVPYEGTSIVLGFEVKGQRYDFYYGSDKENLKALYRDGDGRLINPESIGGMIGTMIGMFASGNGVASDHYAEFDWFLYKEK